MEFLNLSVMSFSLPSRHIAEFWAQNPSHSFAQWSESQPEVIFKIPKHLKYIFIQNLCHINNALLCLYLILTY